jgi:thiol-disulfide isomerase/thioredoxin
MFFVVTISGALIGAAIWYYFVENVNRLNISVPPSSNIVFNDAEPLAMTTAQVANEFEKADGKPILLYIYATWCNICSKNFPTINEIAREFQNTDLQVITLAIDRDLTAEALRSYLEKFGNFYFQPRYLAFKEGFIDFLLKKNIRYNHRVPFAVLVSRYGRVVVKFSGTKDKKYLRNKIINELYPS